VNRGDAFPPLVRTITITDMVAYAGATWDWHRLHYDTEFCAERGMERPVVDGQMLGALMAEQVLDHLGPRGFLTNLGFRFRSMVFAGDTVRVEGEVTAVEDGAIGVRQRVLVEDRLVAEGTARVRV
jgi:acyl dehydratase